MATLVSLERYLPPYRYDQEQVIPWVRAWLEEEGAAAARLLPVYESAGVKRRGSVVPIEEAFRPRDFESQNDRYAEVARAVALDLAQRALASAGLAPAALHAIVSVSCTGFMIPAVEAHVADALRLGPRLMRLPITEAGCAGGVVGLARAADYLAAHPDRCVLLLALELASLTFQRWDRSPANVISAAIFGDGGAAAILAGPEHPRARSSGLLSVLDAESVFFPGTTHLMGFRLRNQGLQILLDRQLTPFLRREVARAVDAFLGPRGLEREDIARFVLHPGGRRIIDVMGSELGLGPEQLAPTRTVLADHGNMSSVTVLFVLDQVLRRHRPPAGSRGLLAAFGPGFGAELALVEFR